MTLRFEPVDLDDVPWDELDALGDRTVWQQRPWLAFLATTQRARPLVAAVQDGPTTVAWFTGAKVRRAGVPILGSPLQGWTTSYQGFNLTDIRFDRVELASALRAWAFGPLRCLHVELLDRRIDEVPAGPGWSRTTFGSWELDLTPDPEALLSATSASCRANIRRAVRDGVTVDEAPADGFASLYHRQLTEVFANQGRKVPFPAGRIEALVDHLPPDQRMLLVAHRSDGTPVATGLFVGSGSTAYLWGQASTRADRGLRPNEAVLWAAITAWRDRGAHHFDFGGGGGRFKAKFGGTPHQATWLRSSRWSAIERARTQAARLRRAHPPKR